VGITENANYHKLISSQRIFLLSRPTINFTMPYHFLRQNQLRVKPYRYLERGLYLRLLLYSYRVSYYYLYDNNTRRVRYHELVSCRHEKQSANSGRGDDISWQSRSNKHEIKHDINLQLARRFVLSCQKCISCYSHSDHLFG
jgi:hypothetical protein